MNLQETLLSILQSAYGEDVRRAIMNGLGLCYSERASGGVDLVEDLNDFQNGILLCTTAVLNHPFDGLSMIISGGNNEDTCQIAFDFTDPTSGMIRSKQNSTWGNWEQL